MKASEVLRLYATGKRDFRGVSLRGQNFKGTDLAGADFSEAKIVGTNFSHTNLRGANSSKARAGVQIHSRLMQGLAILLLAILVGSLQGFFASQLLRFFPIALHPEDEWYYFVPNLLITVSYGIIILGGLVVIARQGFTVKTFGTISTLVVFASAGVIPGAISGAVTGAIEISNAIEIEGEIEGATAVATAVLYAIEGAHRAVVAIPGTGAGAGTALVAGAITVVVTVAVVAAFTVIAVVTVASAVSGAGDMVKAEITLVAVVTVAVILLSTWFGLYVARQVQADDPKFFMIRSFSLVLTTWGGTRFYQAELDGADFSQATLRGANFNQANMTQVYWHNAKYLDLARVGNSILSAPPVRDLLVTRDGYKRLVGK